MTIRAKSNLTYWILVLLLAVLASLNAFLPQGEIPGMTEEQVFVAQRSRLALISAGTMLIVYGGLGFLGLILSRKIGFPDIWDKCVSNRSRFLTPLLIGVGLGFFFILADLIFSQVNDFGHLPHPPFPTSLVASAVAGIGEEIIFRLFLVSLWVWIIACLILKNCQNNWVFWIVALFSGIVFAFGHLPSIMALMGVTQIGQIPPVLMVELILLNGVVSLFAAHGLRQAGFLAAVGIHFWTDIIWHVIWGLFS